MMEREPPFLTGLLLPVLCSGGRGVLRIVRLTCTVVGAVLLAFIGGSLLLSPARQIESSIAIAAPPSKVFGLIADLARWRDWSSIAVSGGAVSITAHSTGPGARLVKGDERSGGQRNSYEIVEVVPDKLIRLKIQPGQDFECRFIDFSALYQLEPSAEGRSTRLVVTHNWNLAASFDSVPLFGRWLGLLMNFVISDETWDELTRLKKLAEKD